VGDQQIEVLAGSVQFLKGLSLVILDESLMGASLGVRYAAHTDEREHVLPHPEHLLGPRPAHENPVIGVDGKPGLVGFPFQTVKEVMVLVIAANAGHVHVQFVEETGDPGFHPEEIVMESQFVAVTPCVAKRRPVHGRKVREGTHVPTLQDVIDSVSRFLLVQVDQFEGQQEFAVNVGEHSDPHGPRAPFRLTVEQR
jgi:hypothetical protein